MVSSTPSICCASLSLTDSSNSAGENQFGTLKHSSLWLFKCCISIETMPTNADNGVSNFRDFPWGITDCNS